MAQDGSAVVVGPSMPTGRVLERAPGRRGGRTAGPAVKPLLSCLDTRGYYLRTLGEARPAGPCGDEPRAAY